MFARPCGLFMIGFCRPAIVAVVAVLMLAACQSKVEPERRPVQAPPVTEAPTALPAPSEGALEDALPPTDLTGAPAANEIRIALLVPLSGPNAAIGRALLDAAQLAVFEVGDENFILLPRDTGGTPEGAAAAADAVINAGARLIVGPLFAAEVPSVAARAQPAGVSVLSLSNDLSVAAPGAYVMGVPPRAQVARVIEFARSRGLSRFAALLPNNSYGAAVEDALYATANRVGGQVTAIERYDPGTTDASPAVRRLASYEARRAGLEQQRRELEARGDEISRQALRRLEGVDTVGELSFDAVLLPDFGERLLAIAPLLPYYDIDPARVRFLGSSLWDDPRVTREPALIGGWFAGPPPESRDAFAKRYRDVYRRDPPRVATIAYDATALAAVLARAEGGPDFSQEAITNPVGFAGMDGVFRLMPDGSIERNLAIIEVRRNGFRTISPAPESFEQVGQ